MSKWQENITYAAGAPGAGPTGNVVNALYVDTTANRIYAWDGAAWQSILIAAGSGTITGAFSLTSDIAATISATPTSDWAPAGIGTAAVIRATSTTQHNDLTGITTGADGRILLLMNVAASGFNIVLKDDATSTAANRFQLNADITLSPGHGAILCYNSTDSRWYCVGVYTTSTGGSGAPTDAEYLVTTLHAGLTNEIAVGTTPGGELGGTWASPTVDASHSGSTHAAVQAAAEATAAAALTAHLSDAVDAHDASAISNVPAGTIAATDVQAALNELDTEKATPADITSAVSAHAGAADPHTGYQKESEKDAASGYAGLSAGSKIALAQISEVAALADLSDVTAKSGTGSTVVMIGSPVIIAPTLSGVTLLPEGSAIKLDAIASADTYSGIIIAGVAAATIVFGDLVYFVAGTSRWDLADADTAATAVGKIGICVQGATVGNATTILLYGNILAATAFPTFTIGAPVYMSETPGDVIQSLPTGTDAVVRTVGFANTADELFFCPSPDYITLV